MAYSLQLQISSARLLNTAEISNPFKGGSRPNLLRRQIWSSTDSAFSYAKRKNCLSCPFSRARQQTTFVTARAQSGSAAEGNAHPTQPVLKQSMSKPAVRETKAVSDQKPVAAKLGTLWGLLVLAIAYVHHSTTGYVWQAAACHQRICIPLFTTTSLSPFTYQAW